MNLVGWGGCGGGMGGKKVMGKMAKRKRGWKDLGWLRASRTILRKMGPVMVAPWLMLLGLRIARILWGEIALLRSQEGWCGEPHPMAGEMSLGVPLEVDVVVPFVEVEVAAV